MLFRSNDTATTEIYTQAYTLSLHVALPIYVMVVQRLPKTRSGKILRKLLRSIIDRVEFQVPSTIDDEAIIGEIKEAYEHYTAVKAK